jgi:hypothetical protein
MATDADVDKETARQAYRSLLAVAATEERLQAVLARAGLDAAAARRVALHLFKRGEVGRRDDELYQSLREDVPETGVKNEEMARFHAAAPEYKELALRRGVFMADATRFMRFEELENEPLRVERIRRRAEELRVAAGL